MNRKITAFLTAAILLFGIVITVNSQNAANAQAEAAQTNVSQPECDKIGMGAGGAFYLPLINPTDSTNYVAACDMGSLYWSEDSGQSWHRTETLGVVNASCFSPEGILFSGGYGLYAGDARGSERVRIYPKEINYSISRNGWGENLFFADNFDNGYIEAVETYNGNVYFITLDWNNNNLRLIKCGYNGEKPTILYENAYGNQISGPMNVTISMTINSDGICFSDEKAVHRVAFDSTAENPKFETLYSAVGNIKEIKQIDGYIFILDDTDTETYVYYTCDFVSFTNLNDLNTLPNYYTWTSTHTFQWHFNHIAGNNLNSIFLSAYSSVPGSYDFYGLLKFDSSGFNWVFDSVFQHSSDNSATSWSYNCVGPIFGICTDANDDDHCLMSNIETVYTMEFDNAESKRVVKTLHCTKTTDGGYSTTGLDVQTTYFVREDPFNSEHIIICCTDLGLENSYDNGLSFVRAENKTYNNVFNTCYDLYFDENTECLVYGIWSSRHDAPYQPLLTDQQNVKGAYAVSRDGGLNWELDYSSGLPENSIPVKMSVIPNGDEFTVAVATFNLGFFISYNSGRTFEPINDGIDAYNGFIWGEDVVFTGDKLYCLTAYHSYGQLTPSCLYEYDTQTKRIVKTDMGEIVNARSLSYSPSEGLLVNVIPYYRYQWYQELHSGFWVNYGGGIYKLESDNSLTQILADEAIYNSLITPDGKIYAVSVYGKVLVSDSDTFRVYKDGLFNQLKNLSISADGKILYVTALGGGCYRLPALQDEPTEETTTEVESEITAQPESETATEPITEQTTEAPTTTAPYESDTEDEAKQCTCKCHADGFKGFIWKILRFFYKLFGINQVCECGAAHY